MSDSAPTSIPSLFLINSDVLNPMKVLVDTAGIVTKKCPEEKSEAQTSLLPTETGHSHGQHGARARSHSGAQRKERRREKSPGPGQRSLLKTGEEPGRMSRRKSETLLFCAGGTAGGAGKGGGGGGGGAGREEKRREVKSSRPRSGGRQRRLSVPSLVLEQAGESINKLTLGSLNKSSRDLSSAATGLMETGHKDLMKYLEPDETPPDLLHLNMLNCPNDSTLQCHCGHINCPCCNLLINLEITDPNILQ